MGTQGWLSGDCKVLVPCVRYSYAPHANQTDFSWLQDHWLSLHDPFVWHVTADADAKQSET